MIDYDFFFNSLKPGKFYQKQHLAISNMIECTISIKCDLCFTYNLFPIYLSIEKLLLAQDMV